MSLISSNIVYLHYTHLSCLFDLYLRISFLEYINFFFHFNFQLSISSLQNQDWFVSVHLVLWDISLWVLWMHLCKLWALRSQPLADGDVFTASVVCLCLLYIILCLGRMNWLLLPARGHVRVRVDTIALFPVPRQKHPSAFVCGVWCSLCSLLASCIFLGFWEFCSRFCLLSVFLWWVVVEFCQKTVSAWVDVLCGFC